MHRSVTFATVTLLLLAMLTLSAHDRYRIVGTIVRLQERQLDVKVGTGKTVAVWLWSNTSIERDKKAVPATALKVGQTVVVDALGDSYYEVDAISVTIVPPIARRRGK